MQNQSAATPRHHVLPTQDAPMSKQGLCRVLRSSSSVLRIGHLEQMRHPFVLREPSAHGPSMVGSHTKQQLTKKKKHSSPYFSNGFPILFQWLSHTFPVVIPMVFPRKACWRRRLMSWSRIDLRSDTCHQAFWGFGQLHSWCLSAWSSPCGQLDSPGDLWQFLWLWTPSWLSDWLVDLASNLVTGWWCHPGDW